MLLRNLRFPQNRRSLFPTRLLKFLRQYRLPLLLLTIAALVEVHLHLREYAVIQPEQDLDAPFYTQCQEPAVDQPRENAALVMLVRNKELDKALRTIQSVEKHFNQWFHYPFVFLNDEPWTEEFMAKMKEATSGEVKFDVLTKEEWSFPRWMDADRAKESIAQQGRAGIIYAGMESYHHMCRFYSGKFYTIPALKSYKWYWRIEPDVDFYCALTYDPFVEMARHDKVYGFTISLPEEKRTCPTLFRHIAEYKEAHQLPTTMLWKAIVSASWAPWPFRSLMAWLFSHTDRKGDAWNMCHYWSNFEIANLDFFRGKEYQELFEYLDRSGGFYHERWGDAAVHSLALAMLLESKHVHHFQDIGYRHDWFNSCPANAPGDKQLPQSLALKKNSDWAPEGRHDDPDAIGCRCECDASKGTMVGYSGYCTKRIKLPNRAKSSGTGFTLFDWL